MSQLNCQLRRELLVYGYIRTQMETKNKYMPLSVQKLCIDFFSHLFDTNILSTDEEFMLDQLLHKHLKNRPEFLYIESVTNLEYDLYYLEHLNMDSRLKNITNIAIKNQI